MINEIFENQRFSGVFREYKMGTLVKNGLIFNPFSPMLHFKSSHTEMFLEKVVLKICSKFTGEHPRQSVISIKLLQ